MGLKLLLSGVDVTNRLNEGTLRYGAGLNARDALNLTLHARRTELIPADGQPLVVYPDGLSYRDTVLADGPLGYWRLGEVADVAAVDETWSGYSLAVSGSPARAQAGPLVEPGWSAMFDGANDYFNGGDIAAFEFTSAFSAECWVKALAAVAVGGLVGKHLTAVDRGWSVKMTATGKINFKAVTTAGVTIFDVTTTASYDDNSWHHVVCTWDGTTAANKVIIYVDGASVKTATAGVGVPDTNSARLLVGARDNGGAAISFFTGSLSEVAAYNLALSSAQVTAHYAARLRAGRLFGGFLVQPDEELDGYSDLITYICDTIDHSSILDRRYIAEVYENMTMGDIARDILENYFADDKVSPAGIEDGPVIAKAVFNYMKGTDVFTELSNLTGYPFTVDENRVFQMRTRASNVNANTITDGQYIRFRVKRDRSVYRNKQYIRAGLDLTSVRIETFVGDGTRRTFTLAFPVGVVPSVQVKTGAGAYVDKTMGILGVDTGKDWYWNKGSSDISQDSAGTLLTDADFLKVTYQGEFPILIESQLDTEIANRQSVEGGSGIYEGLEDRPDIDTSTSAGELASAILARQGRISTIIMIDSYTAGYRPGQLVHLTESRHGIDGDYLIETVDAQEYLGLDQSDEVVLIYSLTCLDGDSVGGWQAFFRMLLSSQRDFVIRDNEVLTKVKLTSDPLSVLDGATADAVTPESRVGWAIVGFSEVGT